ncbi:hypothetical protein QFZ81_003944 [Paenibacillus sp. V4I9]|uniref:hypothetical protein n=1 Tax=Paenibacillus sp. V4I9 TaxID=3042308 RepID=UPI002780C770|nr:hypothetical protein [Paenibacillus sp. V4I9]MDQ0888856.1 hypothetical protein [Paenibacillus sp. V4I9]
MKLHCLVIVVLMFNLPNSVISANIESPQRLNTADVVSIQISKGLHGKYTKTYKAKRFWEKNKITNVVNWINIATENNIENDTVVYGYPDFLRIDFKNGENIYISYAQKCEVRRNVDSTEYTCKRIDDYITYKQGEETKTLYSKQLFDWMKSI